MTQRIQKHPYLAMFDGGETNVSTAERKTTITPIQALFLMNSEFVHEQCRAFAERLMAWSSNPRERIDQAYRMTYARPPAPEELRRAEEYLERAEARLEGAEPARIALESYLRALLSSNEFMFLE
jgi:hypothetical protein